MGARLSVANVAHLIWCKRVHDDDVRPTHRPAPIPPADEEDGDAREAERAHREERHAKRQQRRVFIGGHLEEVVRAKPAERHADQLQDHSREICTRDEGALHRPAEAS